MNHQIEYLNRLEDDLRTAAAKQLSAPASTGRRARAPRALIVAALVLLMSGSLALAFGGRVLTALGDGPAPRHIKSEFQRMVHPPFPLDGAPPLPKGSSLPGKIVLGSQRRVLAIRTASGKLASLYVARTTRGDTCFVSVGAPFGAGGCSTSGALQGPFSGLSTGVFRHRADDKAHVGQGLTIIGHAASPAATLVRIAYADGAHQDVSLVQGWFMFEVPASHTTRAAAPTRIDVISANGTHLGSVNDPFRLHAARPHFTYPVPSSIKLLASAELPNNGGTLKIWSGHDAQGNNCFGHLRNGRSQRSPAWDCTAMVGHYGYPLHPTTAKQSQAHAAVQWEMGLANDPRRPVGFGYAYAYGWVNPSVTRLTIRFQDATASDIPLIDHYYLYVVPPPHWPAGHRPSILEARNAQDQLIYQQFLYPRQHCIYPGHDPICHNLGMGTG
jgi:hypothetical protein